MGATAMILSGAQTLSTAAGQRQQAGAVLASGEYNQRLAEWNAQQAERDAALVTERGKRDVQRQRMATQQTTGAQRAALAASGVEVGSGSAVDVQADTAYLGELDAAAIANDAARQAMGYKAQASDYRQRGILAGLDAKNQASALNSAAFSTLLTGGAQIAGMKQKKKAIG